MRTSPRTASTSAVVGATEINAILAQSGHNRYNRSPFTTASIRVRSRQACKETCDDQDAPCVRHLGHPLYSPYLGPITTSPGNSRFTGTIIHDFKVITQALARTGFR